MLWLQSYEGIVKAPSDDVSENPLKPFVRMIVQQVIRELEENSAGQDTSGRRLMTIAEAASYLALSKREVYNMISTGALLAVQRGRRKMVDRCDLQVWIQENKR